jgi:hypothetical protein
VHQSRGARGLPVRTGQEDHEFPVRVLGRIENDVVILVEVLD